MESGVWGGQAQGGFRFGTSVGFEAIMPTSSMMDFYATWLRSRESLLLLETAV